MPTRRLALATIGAGLLALLMLGVVRFRTSPYAIVTPSAQRISAKPGQSLIKALYQIRNAGRSDLVLGQASSTCGCSVASLSRDVIKPGEEAVVTVEGIAPGAGERTVSIYLPSNDTRSEQLELKLTMVGATEPPYVAVKPPSVNLGEMLIGETGATEVFRIETRERKNSDLWVGEVSCARGDARVTGGLEFEKDFGDNVVWRIYKYEVRIERALAPGDYNSEILVRAREAAGEPFLKLPLHFTVRLPVRATPPRLFASFDSITPPPPFEVMIHTLDSEDTFDVEPAPDNLKDLDIICTSRSKTGYKFKIQFNHIPATSMNTNIRFLINHVRIKALDVPLMLRKDAG